jgi:hypothetical protein
VVKSLSPKEWVVESKGCSCFKGVSRDRLNHAE